MQSAKHPTAQAAIIKLHNEKDRGRFQNLLLSRPFNADSTSLTLFEFSLLTSESFSSEDFSWEIWASWARFFPPDICLCWFDTFPFGDCVCLLSLVAKASMEECKASNSTPVKWPA
jgi:hypothetical protein